MKIKLPEIKPETLLKAASVLFTVGGAIVTSAINAKSQEKAKAEMKAEIMKEIFDDQNS